MKVRAFQGAASVIRLRRRQRDVRAELRQASLSDVNPQWTVPWGRLDAGESPAAAVLRETLEEAGISAELEGLLGVQELPAPWQGWIALVYLCRHVSGECRPDGGETDAARYFSAADLAALAEPVEPWSAWLARRVFAGQCRPILRADANPFDGVMAFLCSEERRGQRRSTWQSRCSSTSRGR